MDNKKNGIPKLRFPGFTGAWEQRKLGEVATFINGRAYKQNELLDSGKYKVLRVGNFYTNDSWYYSNLELADKYYIDEGDLVYTWSATFGPHIWNGEKVIYHYHIWKIELSKFLDRDFTLQILEADKAKLLANTNGSTMIHVTKKDMESKVISLPNIEEQKKIGSYLMKFDSLITLHQRKLEHLQEQKKGLLQKMFPKNGETVPEVRFPGFTDAWEQRKLGEGTLKIGDGLHGTPKYSTSGNVLFINGNNLINGKVVITSETKRVTSNEQSKDDKELNQNTILMSINGTIGSLAWYRNENLMLGKSVAYIEVSEFDKKFVYAYLQTTKVKFYFISSLTGTTIKNLGLKAIRETPLLIPNIEEQEKIGEFFQQLDSLIALHQRKLDHLELMKKGLLQQMFV